MAADCRRVTVPALLRNFDRTIEVPVDVTAVLAETDALHLARIIRATWGIAATSARPTPDWLARLRTDDPRIEHLVVNGAPQATLQLSLDALSGLDWLAAHRPSVLVEALLLGAGPSAVLVDPQWRWRMTDVDWLDQTLLWRDRRSPLPESTRAVLADVGWEADLVLRAGLREGLVWLRDLHGLVSYALGSLGAEWVMSLERALAYRAAGIAPVEARAQEADPAGAPPLESLRVLAVLGQVA